MPLDDTLICGVLPGFRRRRAALRLLHRRPSRSRRLMSLVESSLSRSRSRFRATSKPRRRPVPQQGGDALADELPDLLRGHSRLPLLQSDEGLPVDAAMLPLDVGWLAGRCLRNLTYVAQGRRCAACSP